MSRKKKRSIHDSEEGYDIYAPYYDSSLAFLDSFERYDLFEMMGNVSGKKVLDLGCGTGRMTENLKKFSADVTGCDISEKMLNIAQKKMKNVNFVHADVYSLPFEDNSFDMVIASFLIVHLKYLDDAFSEVNRILRDDGEFLLTNINQRKAPRLHAGSDEIVIKSFYHRPEDVIKSLENNFFTISKERFVNDDKIWINQIVKAKK